MKINDNYIQRFQEVSSLLLNQTPSVNLIKQWYNDGWEDHRPNLQDFFVMHSYHQWFTGIGTIDAVELIIQEAVDNTNLKDDWSVG